jgi:hypothetical protein
METAEKAPPLIEPPGKACLNWLIYERRKKPSPGRAFQAAGKARTKALW